MIGKAWLMYNLCLGMLVLLAIIVFIYLQFFTAPYGRHYKNGFGPSIPNHWGWVIMEIPAVIFFTLVYSFGVHAKEFVPLIFLMMWQFHYVYRSFIFPFRIRTQGKRMPIIIAILGFIFNCFNAYLNAYWISNIGQYSMNYLGSTKFIMGSIIFFIGFCIHFRADGILINLRRSNETGYKIPQGFLFRWVSSPNYLGEIITWLGFAIATWSLAAFIFALFTIANLLPRAIKHLQWYQSHFSDFPKNRRAIIPYII